MIDIEHEPQKAAVCCFRAAMMQLSNYFEDCGRGPIAIQSTACDFSKIICLIPSQLPHPMRHIEMPAMADPDLPLANALIVGVFHMASNSRRLGAVARCDDFVLVAE
jgi:hypothetical protein